MDSKCGDSKYQDGSFDLRSSFLRGFSEDRKRRKKKDRSQRKEKQTVKERGFKYGQPFITREVLGGRWC
jgi:hypothetical protein